METLLENIKKIKKLIKYLDKKKDDLFYDEELTEEGETSSGGASSGYPTVTKWESGVTRGPGNPISNEKRQDKVTRGKANRLI
jgi:hypothetical protein